MGRTVQMRPVVVMKFWPVKPGNGVEGKNRNDPEAGGAGCREA